MQRKICILLAVFILIGSFSFAYASDGDVECSQISFCDEAGNIVTSAYTSGKIIAKATLLNNGAAKIYPVMLVGLYENGLLKNVWYNKNEISGEKQGEVKCEFNPGTLTSSHTVKATVLKSMINLGSYYETATLFENSTDLHGILINGDNIDEYSDFTDFYTVNTKKTDLKVIPLVKDGGTKVTVTKPESIPGVVKVHIKSENGKERNIDIALYEKEEQLYSLQGISYYIGDTRYEITDFDPEVSNYEVTLPENTFYVKALPESVYNNGKTVKVDTYIKDINHQDLSYGGVVYLQGTTESDYKNTFVERLSSDGVIPIKNEQTNAVVKVLYGTKEKTYTITFKAKQPRLTSFDIIGGREENHKPAFIGGAALNNDNGTTTGTDRAWSYTNISKNLIGASMFMFGTKSASNEGNWYAGNYKGAHYTFTADTDGRIYHISHFEITNEEFFNDGWVKIENELPDISDWTKVPRDYNDYDSLFYMNHCSWNSPERFAPDSNTATSGMNIYTMHNVYKKDFKAGEKVTVYNIGAEDKYVGRRAINVSVIKWNLPGTVYPEDNIQGGDEGGDEPIIPPEPEIPPEPVLPTIKEWFNENSILNYIDMFTSWEFSNIEGSEGK